MHNAIFHILGSSALSQLLILVSLPLLTRQYGAADFGFFGVATTLALILSTVFTLRLENSLHRLPEHSVRIVAVITRCIILGMLCLIPIISVFVWLIDTHWLNAVAILVFASGHALFISRSLLLNLQQNFRKIAYMQLAVPLMFVSVALSFGTGSYNFNGLLISQSVAYAFAGFLGLIWTKVGGSSLQLDPAELKPMALIKQEIDSVRYLVPAQLLAILSQNALVIGAVVVFSEQSGGLLLIAQRISRAPVMVIGNGLNEVLRSRLVDCTSTVNSFKVVSALGMATGVIMVISIWSIPESLLLFLLGEQWVGIQSIVRITILVAAFQLMATAVMSVLSTFEKRTDLLINTYLSVGSFVVLSMCWLLSGSLIIYLWLSGVCLISVYLWGYIRSWKTVLRISQ